MFLRMLAIIFNTMGGTLFQQRYGKSWDEELNYLLDNYEISNVDRHHAIINNQSIWISNEYYCYGHCWAGYRPSIKTMARLSLAVDRFIEHGPSDEEILK